MAWPSPFLNSIFQLPRYSISEGGVSQISLIRNIMLPSISNYTALSYLEAGFPNIPSIGPTTLLLKKLWSAVKTSLGISGFLLETPLYRNPLYFELNKLEGFQVWEMASICFLSQLYIQNVLNFFSEIQDKSVLPRQQFFKYCTYSCAMPFRHKRSSPFWHCLTTPLYGNFCCAPQEKALSQIYSILNSTTQNSSSVPCKREWERDLGDISEEVWEMFLHSVNIVSVLPSHKLSQLFILHRAYRTPSQLHRWGRRDSPICPKCNIEEGTLIHLLWRCPKLF